MSSSLLFWLLALVLVLVLLSPSLVTANADKCASCRVVATELEVILSNEKPRNHIDLRHRLDSKGQREGRVIEYRVSELRIVEVLEDLCSRFKDYTYNETQRKWNKLANKKTAEYDKQQAETDSKLITSYCGRLVEKNEDEIARKIKNGELETGNVEQKLCWEISRDCYMAEEHEL